MTQAPGALETPETTPGQTRLVDRLLQWTVLAVLVITVVLYALAPFLAIGWAQRPFIGAFVEKTFVFNGIGDPDDPAWSARQRIPEGDHLLAVDGAPVATSFALGGALADKMAGETIVLTTRSRDGSVERQTAVTLSAFPLPDLTRLFIAPYLIGVIYLGIGWWVFQLRRGEPAGRAFALTCALAAIAIGALFDLYTTHLFTWAWTIAVPNVGAAAMSLALVFPKTASPVSRRPLLRLISFVPGLLLAAYALVTVYWPGSDPYAYVVAWRYSYFYLGAGLLVLLSMMLYRWRFSPSPTVSAQSRIIFLGAVAAFLPLLIWVLQGLLTNQTPYFNVLVNFGPLVLFPAAVAYAILRYRLLDADVLLGQGIVYGVIGALTVVGYSLIITGLSLVAGVPVNANDPLALGLVVLILVIVFNPLHDRLRRLVDKTFFRGSRQYAQRLEQFGRIVNQAPGLIEIAQALTTSVVDVLRPAHAHVFLRDEAGDEYAAAPDAAGRPTTDLRFAADGALAFHLAAERAALVLLPDQPLPQRLVRDRARLAVLGSALFVPLSGKDGLTGWLAVGPKLSGDPFQSDDLRFVDSLADQAALAIERATVISDLERRVKELNVVSQMSQAVSFTRAFGDLLELIYAQTSKILDARNFYLLLKDRRGVARYTVYVENDDRLSDQEGRPVSADSGLEAEVVRSGQPICVDDYTQECHRRGVTPGDRLYRAWLGVPLNAGADTIGAMIVAASDPTVVFTEDQAKVFATIADQAASAIVRARLLQQAEQRARQLATLNEVSLTIASTLELDPLLQKIVQSAASILNCEAGSLFLTDAETGESVFRVATGPVGQNLVGMRIAPGKGFVGEAIETGRAVIVNDVQNDARWFKGTDQSTGFVTHALITVPLRYQGRPIGAVQLINKRDGAPFDEDDQSLLTAFATPSAIAIENARLFTQTDQALAARVEELSIMQRIGRELNTTLDTALVANISLNWAMKNTAATAGWLGLVGEGGIYVIEVEGYGEAERLLAAPLPADYSLPGRLLRTGDVILLRDARADPDYTAVLESTRSVLSAPIRREGQVIGLVNLESIHPDGFTQEHAAFVTRLLDLTSIALTNSRLYADVEKANADKSELMSFVAHELKTPMTPIKGYADLLATASVGPVNDMQRQFLDTIRKNIERMTVIVNDLNDSAKIEAGKLKVYPKAVPLSGLVEEVVRTIKSVAEAKQQTVTVEIAPDLEPAWVDPYRVSQVLTNLVSNAHKYTPEGGHIHIRAARAANHADPAGPLDMLQVSVQDNGLGISPEEQKKIFQKFFRSEDRQAREMAPGTGLGLSIVKSLVELQGGQIWFESEFRKGSTFHFTLPMAVEGERQPAAIAG